MHAHTHTYTCTHTDITNTYTYIHTHIYNPCLTVSLNMQHSIEIGQYPFLSSPCPNPILKGPVLTQ